MEIQDFLIAAVQNITILIRQSKRRMSKSNVKAEKVGYYQKRHYMGLTERLLRRISGLSGIHNCDQWASFENPI